MGEAVRPIVVFSKCITFAPCRYNGLIIADEFVERLRPYVEARRVVDVDGELRLLQPATKRDVTAEMQSFCESFLGSLPGVHGFILKGRSPSCGMKDVRVHSAAGKSAGRDRGFFGGAVLDHFPHLAVEDEGRLRNWRIREHFLTKLYTLARFDRARAANAMRALVQFHSANKFLLMAYNQKELRALGRIVANPQKRPVSDVLADYEQHLLSAFARVPRYTSNINVLMHGLGYFSKGLTAAERAFFLETLEKYRAGRVPLSVPLGVLNAWIVRFDEGYLRQQTFFQPYPEELMEISDSGKGRNL